MRRARHLLVLLLCASQAWGATRYVDNGCTNNGDGTAIDCGASGGAAGPWNSIANALGSWACGDTVNVRGDHATHGSNHAGTQINGKWGTYRTDKWNITNACTAGANQLIIQAYGWTAAGAATQEVAVAESVTTLTSGNWTQCAWDGSACDCDAGNQNVQIGAGGSTACTETWYHTKASDGANRTYWATKPDGSITPRRNTLAGMTAQYDANKAPQCAGGASVGVECSSDGDCPASTCNKTILVRWGGSVPSDPSVNFSNNGNLWFLNGADYVTIRGFTVRRAIRAIFYASPTADNNTFQDNVVKYINDSAAGSARAVEIDSSTGNQILDNEFAYTSSEPLHITTFTDGTISGTISRNWVHGIGDVTMLGDGTSGTPNCTTFTNDASGGNPTSGIASPWDTGDNAGLVVDSNLFDTCNERDAAKGAYGIYLESTVKNAVFSNNIISGVAACIELRPFHSTPINGGINGINTNTFYNNLCVSPVAGTHDASGSCFNLNADGQASPNAAINGNKFFNNTCDDNLDVCIKTGTGSGLGNTTTNTFTNNICVKDSLSSPTNFIANHTTATGLTISKNVIWSGKTSGQCGVVNNATVNCGDVGCEFCADPILVSETDNHIQTSSPAKNAGTSTGMPAGRTLDICNSIASAHGLPSYNDCQAASGTVDIGADEFAAGGAGRRKIIVSSLDGPEVCQ